MDDRWFICEELTNSRIKKETNWIELDVDGRLLSSFVTVKSSPPASVSFRRVSLFRLASCPISRSKTRGCRVCISAWKSSLKTKNQKKIKKNLKILKKKIFFDFFKNFFINFFINFKNFKNSLEIEKLQIFEKIYFWFDFFLFLFLILILFLWMKKFFPSLILTDGFGTIRGQCRRRIAGFFHRFPNGVQVLRIDAGVFADRGPTREYGFLVWRWPSRGLDRAARRIWWIVLSHRTTWLFLVHRWPVKIPNN